MDLLNNLINKYNNSIQKVDKDSNIELEISFHLIKNKDLYTQIFNILKKESSNIIIYEYINIYYENNLRLTKQFKDGKNLNKDIYLTKKILNKSYSKTSNLNVLKKYNIKLNLEEIISNNELKKFNIKDIKLIKLKLRLSFLLKKNSNIKIDLDLVHNFNIKQSNLKNIKDRIFKGYKLNNITEELNYDLFDELILETEFLNNSFLDLPLDSEHISNTITYIYSILDLQPIKDSINYQDYIYLIASFIINNKLYLENFKQKSGLKKLLNNVIEMNSEMYYKHIKPQITSYYITDKIDGQRCIIIFNQYNDLLNIKLITNKIYQISEYNDELNNIKNYTILDSEFIIPENLKNSDSNELSKNDVYLYIFDIIALNNNSTSYIPFENRLELLNDGFNKIKNLLQVKCKEFIKLSDNYKNELSDFYNKKNNNKNYKIDGLIFTPSSNVNNKNYKYKINSNYNNMIGYKWKPIEEVTIDFYIKLLPKNLYAHKPYNDIKLSNNEYIYILFSGISKHDFDKLNLSYISNYKKLIPEEFHNKSYFPIQFSTSDNPNNYIFISSNNDLDNLIGEFSYINNKWTLKKIRLDRTIELKRGEYFGNYFKIAELIWNNIKNPLTFDMLLKDDDNNYFLIDDNQMYKSLRSYNSFVKSYLLETITNSQLSDKNNTDWIIDLASGKGQDLGRINNLGFKNGLFLDVDKNALLELINRKYSLRSSKEKNIKIFTQEINLTTNYKNIIQKIDKFNIKKESIDVMICNFAIHYIIKDTNSLFNLIQLLDYYLKPNGRFIFTCFNGNKVFKLLENSDEWNLYENDYLKYSIKKLYSNNSIMQTGQQIDVLLPFSNKKYYTEYLINQDYISSVFNDNNFTEEISDSFSCLLDNFKNNNLYSSLSSQDKEFIDLYQYTIFKKNFNNNILIKSNIKELFPISCNNKLITGSNDILSDNILVTNTLPLSQLDNINNSNSILLIINTTNSNIINYINDYFESNNYKNKNKNKRNKNKIIKILAFEDNDLWYSIYNYFQNNNKINYESIIFYNSKYKIFNNYSSYILKKPIVPILLSDENTFITIFNNTDIHNILSLKFISNQYDINYNQINQLYTNKKILTFNIKILKIHDEYTC